MRLNGWQRIGIVASVIWVPVGIFWSLGRLYNPIYQQFGHCIAASFENFKVCESIEEAQLAFANRDRPVIALLAALVPIVVLWLAGYVIAWIRRGFRDVAT